ncbi:MAG: integrase [Methylobacterium sp.]|nr:integrase [Methylobacterium sp.]
MLSDDLDRHISLHHALGFKFRTQSLLLRNFAAYAEARGDRVISAERILAWAVEAPSPQQRRNRLLEVRRFAIAMHAEDGRHEIPAADALGRGLFTRRIPYIYSQDDIRRLMAAAAALSPAGTIRPLTFTTLFGLLAATGMRISEALALRLADITDDGLIIDKTKFKKSRLLPLHPSTRRSLEAYLAVRLRVATESDALLIGSTGEAVAYPTVIAIFLRLMRSIGLRGSSGRGGLRVHDLRHTFAVRSLEECPRNAAAVSRHIVALSTYLGHAHVTDTYWYLQASPALMTHIAEAGEALQRGEA